MISLSRHLFDMRRPAGALAGKIFLLTLIFSVFFALPVSAQVAGSGSSFYGKFGTGLSDYTGDFPIQTWGHPFDLQEFSRGSGLPLATVGELGYAISPAFAVAVGFQGGNYPIAGYAGGSGVTDSDRYTVQLLSRYSFGSAGQRVAPYVDGGINATFGGYSKTTSTGFGPSLGGGLDVRLGRTLSLYVESRLNLILPDDAVDGSTGIGDRPGSVTSKTSDPVGSITGPFDAITQLVGFGLKIDLGRFTGPRTLPEAPASRPLASGSPESAAPEVPTPAMIADAGATASGSGLRNGGGGSSLLVSNANLTARPAERTGERWAIVVGSFERGEGAQRMLRYYRNRSDSTLRPVEAAAGEPGRELRFRIVVGRFETPEAARQVLREHEAELPQGAWLLRMR